MRATTSRCASASPSLKSCTRWRRTARNAAHASNATDPKLCRTRAAPAQGLPDASAHVRRAPPPQGRDLCYKLSNPGLASTIKTAPAQLQAQLAIEVVSPILANANNPLTVVR